jgi:hypothetical protein
MGRAYKNSNLALIAVWLILFQLFAPFAYAGQDVTFICSERGVEEIRYDSEGNAIPLLLKSTHCELCITGDSPDTALPSQQSLDVPSKIVSPLLNSFNDLRISDPRFSLLPSRAPPLG